MDEGWLVTFLNWQVGFSYWDTKIIHMHENEMELIHKTFSQGQ